MKKKNLAVGALCLALLTGCTSLQQRNTTLGAVVGAGTGAVIGKSLEGAVIGGLVGGSAGYLMTDDKK